MALADGVRSRLEMMSCVVKKEKKKANAEIFSFFLSFRRPEEPSEKCVSE